MGQHLGLQRESAGGIEAFDEGRSVPPELFDLITEDAVCARRIDPYADTLFVPAQLPALISEFRAMASRAATPSPRQGLEAVVGFLEEACRLRARVRFIGD